MKLKISVAASRDIDEICLYGLVNFGEEQADRYLNLMLDRFDIICSNPEIGRLDSRTTPAVRHFDFQSHAIFYDIVDDSIHIIRILHRSADFLRHLPS